jgi:small GTP-binding protein
VHYKTVRRDGKEYNLRLIDTAGVEGYYHLRQESIKKADAIIITYSIGNLWSFQLVKSLHQDIMELRGLSSTAACIVLVGTGLDEESSSRSVLTSSGVVLAKELGCKFYECSNKTGQNVNKIFLDIVQTFPCGEVSKPLGWGEYV